MTPRSDESPPENDKNSRELRFTLRKKLLIFFALFFCLMLMISVYVALAHRGTATLTDRMMVENELLERTGEKLNLLEHHTTSYLNRRTEESHESYREIETELLELKETEKSETVSEFDAILSGLIAESRELIEMAEADEDYHRAYTRFRERIDITTRYLTEAINSNNRQANRIYAASSDLVSRIENYGIGMAALLAGFSLIFLYLFSRSITGPLYRIIARSRRLAEGDFAVEPVRVDTSDELSFIARAFNRMMAELETLFNRLEEKLEVERELQQKQVENLRMKNLLKEAELKKLQSQMNPHFLFNTLNSISQLAVLEEADRTGRMITRLAEHFRRNLKRSEKLIPVKEELKSVDLYCDILRTRFGENIEFNFDYDRTVLSNLIPPLTIQPLVENAFVHGVKKSSGRSGRIDVIIERPQDRAKKNEGKDEEGWLRITVKDDGAGMGAELIESIQQEEKIGGLSNIKERLRLFYQRDDLLTIAASPGSGTEIVIDIPPAEKSRQGPEAETENSRTSLEFSRSSPAERQ